MINNCAGIWTWTTVGLIIFCQLRTDLKNHNRSHKYRNCYLPDTVEEQLEQRRLLVLIFADAAKSFREGVAKCDPFFLDETLESVDGAEVRIHNQLGQ